MNYIPLITATVAILLFVIKEIKEYCKEIKQNKEIIHFMELEISKNKSIITRIFDNLSFFDKKEDEIKRIIQIEDQGMKYNLAIDKFLNENVSDDLMKLIQYSIYSLSVSSYKEIYSKKPFDIEGLVDHYITLEEMSKLIKLIESLPSDSKENMKLFYLLKAIFNSSKKINNTYEYMVLKNKMKKNYEDYLLENKYKLKT